MSIEEALLQDVPVGRRIGQLLLAKTTQNVPSQTQSGLLFWTRSVTLLSSFIDKIRLCQ